jgi:4-amino-4-deoxy-L-arabinose transferase-like glycosyltransferase
VYDGNLNHCPSGRLFAAISLFFVIANLIWLRLDRSPPSWDDGFYLTKSLVMYDALSNDGLFGYAKRSLTVMGDKPPLIAILPTPIYLLAGRRWRAAYAINLMFLLVILAVLYEIGSRYASRRAGLLAVFIAGTMPILYGLARWYLVECGLTAIVCLAIAIASNWKGDHWRAFLLGATCGFGLLLKFSFPIYVLIPILYFAIREKGAWLGRKTLLAFGIPATAITLPWYLLNFRRALETALNAGSEATAKAYQTGDVYSAKDVLNYLVNLLNCGPSLYFVIALLLLLALARFIRPSQKSGLFLCMLWGSPVLLLIFGHYRDLRYAAPLFPALALALAVLIDAALERWRVAFAVAAILLVLPLLSMLQTSFGVFGNKRFELGGLLFVAPRLDYARRYSPVTWPQREILMDIRRVAKSTPGETTSIVVGTDSVRFNANNFELVARQERLPFEVSTTAYETNISALLSSLDSRAFFVYESGGESESPFNSGRDAAVKHVRESGTFLELPLARTLADGGVAHVFANRATGRFIRSGAFIEAGLDSFSECNVNFAYKLQLTGLSLQHTSQGLEVKYRWRCLKPVDRDYWCFTHILDAQESVAGYLDHPILGGQPGTSLWKPGDVAIERLIFRIPQGQAAGIYHLRLGLFYPSSQERLAITESDFPLADKQTAVVAGETSIQR